MNKYTLDEKVAIVKMAGLFRRKIIMPEVSKWMLGGAAGGGALGALRKPTDESPGISNAIRGALVGGALGGIGFYGNKAIGEYLRKSDYEAARAAVLGE